MSALEFLATAGQNATETAAYLFAYAFVLVLAPLAHVVLVGVGGRWSDERMDALGAVRAALTSSLSRASIEASLRRATSSRAVLVFLASSHALTVHSWILLGPLLGKNFLLSHVVGLLAFLTISTVWIGKLDIAAPVASAVTDRLGLVTARNAILLGMGLLLGGGIAAWGLSEWTWAPAELGGGGFRTQLASGGIGILLALAGIPPVANLFAGTYLWKTGLAHAGIVTFFCAAPAAPTRWRIYARAFGRVGAARLVTVMLVSALLAGLATAWVLGRTDVGIRYRLLPQQLWSDAG